MTISPEVRFKEEILIASVLHWEILFVEREKVETSVQLLKGMAVVGDVELRDELLLQLFRRVLVDVFINPVYLLKYMHKSNASEAMIIEGATQRLGRILTYSIGATRERHNASIVISTIYSE